jgi:hypothetical protein
MLPRLAEVGAGGGCRVRARRGKLEVEECTDKWVQAVSGTRGRKERAAAVVVSADGSAHHGRKEREGEGERAEGNGPTGRNRGREGK